MNKTICGLDCSQCGWKDSCPGCSATNGRPFGGGQCMVFACCQEKECAGDCFSGKHCALREPLLQEFNSLGIEDMPEVTSLNVLPGSYINLQYTLPGGQTCKLWEDEKLYFANQLEKKNSDRCYGLTADKTYLLVCEYGCEGADPEIVLFKRWN